MKKKIKQRSRKAPVGNVETASGPKSLETIAPVVPEYPDIIEMIGDFYIQHAGEDVKESDVDRIFGIKTFFFRDRLFQYICGQRALAIWAHRLSRTGWNVRSE
jgi:hypothetical protein